MAEFFRTSHGATVSDRKFRLLYRSMMDCFASVDMSGRIVDFNEPFLKLTGFSPEELQCLTYRDLTPEKWHLHETSVLEEQVLTRGYSDIYEKEYRRKDGAWVPVELRTFLIRDESNEPEGMWAIVRDVTQRKQTEERLAERQRTLRHLLDVQERDRKLISHEIHDGFLQRIIAAEMFLQSVEQDLVSQGNTPLKDLESAREQLGQGILEARRLIEGLRPAGIEEEGVLRAIHALLAAELRKGALRIEFQCQVQFDRLEPGLEAAIFRIVQESLNNVKRHSQSKTAVVRLAQDGETLLMEVHDAGIGFNPGEVSESRFGIRGICERAQLFGGQAKIDSQPGKGTTVTVRLPLVLSAGVA
jgi:PAS domain S-box-containing protein